MRSIFFGRIRSLRSSFYVCNKLIIIYINILKTRFVESAFKMLIFHIFKQIHAQPNRWWDCNFFCHSPYSYEAHDALIDDRLTKHIFLMTKFSATFTSHGFLSVSLHVALLSHTWIFSKQKKKASKFQSAIQVSMYDDVSMFIHRFRSIGK